MNQFLQSVSSAPPERAIILMIAGIMPVVILTDLGIQWILKEIRAFNGKSSSQVKTNPRG